MIEKYASPFQIGDIVSFSPRSGPPAGLVGVVIGYEFNLNEDTAVWLDGLSRAPESFLSADEQCSRVCVHIPMQWPENRSLSKAKAYVSKLSHNGYFCVVSGPLSLNLESTSSLKEKHLDGWTVWECSCDHKPTIKAIGSTQEMARLKLAHELIKQPHLD